MAVYELFIDGELQGQIEGRSVSSYPGHWRIGYGNISGYPDAGEFGFVGDVPVCASFGLRRSAAVA